MKQLTLIVLFVVSTSAQTVFAQADWKAPNARPLISAACEAQTTAQKILGTAGMLLSCTTETTTAYASDAFDLADSLAVTSSQLLEFRIVNGKKLDMQAKIYIENLEDQIDRLVAKFRARGTATILLD